MPLRREPNFLLGGTSAGGTSFLSALLIQHPEVYLPREMRPEPHFFYKSWEYEQGFDYYLDRWFGQVPEEVVAIGERSSSYLYGGAVTASRISRHLPSARMVFVLRDPVDRAWANYRYTVLEGLEDLDFVSALEREEDRVKAAEGVWAEIQPHDYTGRGYYGEQLLGYLEHFDASRILVLKSEDLREETDREFRNLCVFLGLEASVNQLERPSDYTSVSVVDAKTQTRVRSYFGQRFDPLIEIIREGGDPFRYSGSEADSRMINELVRNLSDDKSPIPEEARLMLVERYKEDLEVLDGIVDFDVSDWLV